MTHRWWWFGILVGLVSCTACRGIGSRGGGAGAAARDPEIGAGFSASFDEEALAPETWRSTADAYAIVDGELVARDARNHPLWLRQRLPCDVRIEFTAWSDSDDGDIKVEIFGDGHSSATSEGAYTATGYVVIFGGWRNRIHTIARQDEHGARLVELREPRVERGRKYRFSIRIRGGAIDWDIDGQPFAHVEDPEPLCGAGHDHFAFSDWTAPLHFDDLSIAPLE
jgi:hypothetical protein